MQTLEWRRVGPATINCQMFVFNNKKKNELCERKK